MDSARVPQDMPSSEAVEFVRFCYRRRRAGWPELYDEMCAVASRGTYLGWTHSDLADHGIRFSLFDLPSLAALVRRVAAEEAERRRALGAVLVNRADVREPGAEQSRELTDAGRVLVGGVAAS